MLLVAKSCFVSHLLQIGYWTQKSSKTKCFKTWFISSISMAMGVWIFMFFRSYILRLRSGTSSTRYRLPNKENMIISINAVKIILNLLIHIVLYNYKKSNTRYLLWYDAFFDLITYRKETIEPKNVQNYTLCDTIVFYIFYILLHIIQFNQVFQKYHKNWA